VASITVVRTNQSLHRPTRAKAPGHRELSRAARKEQLYAQTCRMEEKCDRLLAQRKLEKVQEKLAEAWPEIQRVVPDLPEASEIREPEQQIELLQVAWTQLATCTEQIQEKLQQVQQEAEQQPRQLQEQMQKIILQGNNARADTT
jgi:hypothetical protein